MSHKQDVTSDEFRFAVGVINTNSEMVQHMFANLAEAPDEVTRTFQAAVVMTAGVVFLVSKNAQDHATVEHGADAAMVEAELAGKLFASMNAHRTQLEACQDGNVPPMPARPDKDALVAAIAALETRVTEVSAEIESCTDVPRATAARLLMESAVLLLKAAKSGVEPSELVISDEAVTAKVQDTIKDLVEMRGWTEEAATAKVHEILGATLAEQKEKLTAMIKAQQCTDSEGVEMANLITTDEQCPLVTEALDATKAILTGASA